ncbi:porin [Spartinivicinus poritis]|uniref:Porin n=1 Tax=Spartinivicinus poritis TaxID=2994640 RepID=A0ABT5U3F9_9GAMM|nr:porin [Spartinivicinus sp. A2-2]MDE1460847.1 porin [Spartinivicinus sp. A2-2]
MKSTKLVSLVSFAVVASVASNSIFAASHGKDDDIELYGEIEIRSLDRETTDLDTIVDKARIGFKGAHKLNMSGVKGRWQIEFNLPSDNDPANDSTDDGDVGLRKANVGLQGDFGEVIFGRQNNILADTKVIDTFKNDSGVFLFAPDRLGNAMTYVTPNMGGFHGYVQVATDADPEENDVDATVWGANYSDDTFYFGISRYDEDDDYIGAERDVTSLGAKASFGDFSVFGTLQDEDHTNTLVYGVGIGLTMNDWTFKTALYGFDSDDDGRFGAADGSDDEGRALFFLADYALGHGISTFAQYVYYDEDAEDEGFGGSVFSVGIAAEISRTLM